MKKWTGEFVPTAAPATARLQDLQLQTVGPKVDKVRPRDGEDDNERRKRTQQNIVARMDAVKASIRVNKLELKRIQDELKEDEKKLLQLENDALLIDDISKILTDYDSFYDTWEDGTPQPGSASFANFDEFAESKLNLSDNLFEIAMRTPELKQLAIVVQKKKTFISKKLFYRLFEDVASDRERVNLYAEEPSPRRSEDVFKALVRTKSFISITPNKVDYVRGNNGLYYPDHVDQLGDAVVYGYQPSIFAVKKV